MTTMNKDEKLQLEEVFMFLSYTFAKRVTRGQKSRAMTFINDQVCQKTKRQYDYLKVGGGKVGFTLFGDLTKCRKVILTSLDTPKKHFKNDYTYYPFNDELNLKNERMNIIALILQKLMLAFLLFGGLYLAQYKFHIEYFYLWYAILLIVFTFIHDTHVNNFTNFNKSTASLSLLTYLMQEKDDNTVYVLLEKCAEGTTGLKAFVSKYEKELVGKKVIYLDCLASGKTLLLASVEESNLELTSNELNITVHNFKKTNIPNIFTGKVKLNVLMSGEFEGEQFVVKNTRSKKDCKIDIQRLKQIGEWLKSL